MSEFTEKLFYGNSLKEVRIGKNNELYQSIDGIFYNKSKTELLVASTAYAANSYVIPYGVKNYLRLDLKVVRI